MDYILVCFPTTGTHRQQLRTAAPEAEFCFHDETPGEEFLARVNIVLGNPPVDWLKKMPNLQFVQLNSAGVEPYAGLLPGSVALTNASGAYGPGIAEHSIGMALMLMKKLHRYRDVQHTACWVDLGNVGTFIGAKVLVVGMGDIGREFARRANALGAAVTGIKRTPGIAPEYVEALYTMERLDECLAQADVVFMSLPGTPATKGLFDRQRIGRMKQGSILINVGRGNAVDLDALCDAIVDGRLLGAAVDVTDPEPLPPEHRAWRTEDLLITPHISGGFHMKLTHDRIAAIAAGNLRRFLTGEPLSNVVDRELLY